VLAVVRVFYYAGPAPLPTKVLRALLRTIHISREVERVVLAYLLILSRSAPVSHRCILRSPHHDDFPLHVVEPLPKSLHDISRARQGLATNKTGQD